MSTPSGACRPRRRPERGGRGQRPPASAAAPRRPVQHQRQRHRRRRACERRCFRCDRGFVVHLRRLQVPRPARGAGDGCRDRRARVGHPRIREHVQRDCADRRTHLRQLLHVQQLRDALQATRRDEVGGHRLRHRVGHPVGVVGDPNGPGVGISSCYVNNSIPFGDTDSHSGCAQHEGQGLRRGLRCVAARLQRRPERRYQAGGHD